MSKGLELYKKIDPTADYILTKIQVKNEDSRYVQVGDKCKGSPVVVGDRLAVDHVMTSSILDFQVNGPHFLIETRNSVYTLEKLGDKNE